MMHLILVDSDRISVCRNEENKGENVKVRSRDGDDDNNDENHDVDIPVRLDDGERVIKKARVVSHINLLSMMLKSMT